MTNREWLNSLSDEELAILCDDSCQMCASQECCGEKSCVDGVTEWLKKKHIKTMPKIKIGDVLYSYIDETRASFVVMSDTYASNLHGIIVRWREINDIWKIERMNDEKGMQEVIWRADDE